MYIVTKPIICKILVICPFFSAYYHYPLKKICILTHLPDASFLFPSNLFSMSLQVFKKKKTLFSHVTSLPNEI